MSLFLITLLNGIGVAILGALFLTNPLGWQQSIQAFPRNRIATVVLMAAGAGWFLYHVTQFGEADYGNYKNILFGVFLAVALLSFYWTPDFLAVRGLTILMLLLAKENLDAAFMRWELPQRLVFVTFTYIMITLAMYLAVSPFRVRDFLEWGYKEKGRIQFFGACLLGSGLALVGVALTY